MYFHLYLSLLPRSIDGVADPTAALPQAREESQAAEDDVTKSISTSPTIKLPQ
jgi:hypothetical protein